MQSAFIGVRSRDMRDTVASRVALASLGGPDVERVRCGQRGQCSVEQSTPRSRGRGFRGAKKPECRKSATAPTGNRAERRTLERSSGVAARRCGRCLRAPRRRSRTRAWRLGWAASACKPTLPILPVPRIPRRIRLLYTNTNHHAVHALRNARPRERALDALWGAPVR